MELRCLSLPLLSEPSLRRILVQRYKNYSETKFTLHEINCKLKLKPRGWFCFFPCTSSEINWAVYIGVLLQKWRSASFVASRDLSFCRPAAVPLVNAYDSVPVQSYRSEGSWALCLVIPWERLNCPALWEPKHWFYRQNYKRERGKKTDDESPSSPYWEDSQLW